VSRQSLNYSRGRCKEWRQRVQSTTKRGSLSCQQYKPKRLKLNLSIIPLRFKNQLLLLLLLSSFFFFFLFLSYVSFFSLKTMDGGQEWKTKFQKTQAEVKAWQETLALKISDLDDLHTVLGELLKH
jgi:hypothetical protein